MGTQHLVGYVLNDTYRIDRVLAWGLAGAVCEASHLRIPRRFAIKLMANTLVRSQDSIARFQREARVTSELGHPHIVEVVDFNLTPEGVPYFVMEYLEGEDLATRLSRVSRLSPYQVLSILNQVGSALHLAHRKGVIHRDLKPENIFLCFEGDQDDYVKIMDFGMSKVHESTLTPDNTVIGTLWYMAPEQILGHSAKADLRTDIFSLGVILYETLTGSRPFEAEIFTQLVELICNSEPVAFNALRPDLPAALGAVVHQAMAKKPEDRYPTVHELVREFRAAIKEVLTSEQDFMTSDSCGLERVRTGEERLGLMRVKTGEDSTPIQRVKTGEEEGHVRSMTFPGHALAKTVPVNLADFDGDEEEDIVTAVRARVSAVMAAIPPAPSAAATPAPEPGQRIIRPRGASPESDVDEGLLSTPTGKSPGIVEEPPAAPPALAGDVLSSVPLGPRSATAAEAALLAEMAAAPAGTEATATQSGHLSTPVRAAQEKELLAALAASVDDRSRGGVAVEAPAPAPGEPAPAEGAEPAPSGIAGASEAEPPEVPGAEPGLEAPEILDDETAREVALLAEVAAQAAAEVEAAREEALLAEVAAAEEAAALSARMRTDQDEDLKTDVPMTQQEVPAEPTRLDDEDLRTALVSRLARAQMDDGGDLPTSAWARPVLAAIRSASPRAEPAPAWPTDEMQPLSPERSAEAAPEERSSTDQVPSVAEEPSPATTSPTDESPAVTEEASAEPPPAGGWSTMEMPAVTEEPTSAPLAAPATDEGPVMAEEPLPEEARAPLTPLSTAESLVLAEALQPQVSFAPARAPLTPLSTAESLAVAEVLQPEAAQVPLTLLSTAESLVVAEEAAATPSPASAAASSADESPAITEEAPPAPALDSSLEEYLADSAEPPTEPTLAVPSEAERLTEPARVAAPAKPERTAAPEEPPSEPPLSAEDAALAELAAAVDIFASLDLPGLDLAPEATKKPK